MNLWVSGSLAYDIILDYRGRFADHINPGKVHVLSLSFLVNGIKKSVGGTAGNIVYNLAMLGLRPSLLAAVGEDGRQILKLYKDMSIDIKLSKISRHPTAAAYIMTDADDNQIAAFHPGAMSESVKLPKVKSNDWAIIAAENPANMARLARYYSQKKIKYIFDPGQAITALSKAQMRECVGGAAIVIGNDYEIDYIGKKIGLTRDERSFKNYQCMIIRTLGAKGSELILTPGKIIKIGAARAKAVDPTGAGDAYRAGFIAGIAKGLDLKRSAQLGASAAAFAVEKAGTQNHRFNYGIIVKRHNKSFSDKIIHA